MKVLTYRTALMVAASVFLIPLSAQADVRQGSIEFEPFYGYNYFQNKQNLKDRPVYGLRLGYNITNHVGIEAVVELMNSRVKDRTLAFGPPGQFRAPTNNVNPTFYHLDALYHFMPDNNFTPFVVAGFGGVHYTPRISTKDMPGFNVGLGAKYSLTDNIALRVDVRDYIVTEIFQSSYHNVGATVGLSFAFGGTEKAAPAPAPKQEAKKPVVREKVIILASEPEVEKKVAVAAAESKVAVIAFEDTHFDFDQATLTPEAKLVLKRNVLLMNQNPNVHIMIAGYTSSSGTTPYNQDLSERRANAVKEYLVNEGLMSSDRLSTIGYGENNPAQYEALPQEIYSPAAKENMRVLFEIIVK